MLEVNRSIPITDIIEMIIRIGELLQGMIFSDLYLIRIKPVQDFVQYVFISDTNLCFSMLRVSHMYAFMKESVSSISKNMFIN